MATENPQAWQRLTEVLVGTTLADIYYWYDWRFEFQRGEEKIVAGFFMPWLIMNGANPVIGKHDLPNGQSDPITDALNGPEIRQIDPEDREVVMRLGTVTGGGWESEATYALQFDSGLRLILFRSRIGNGLLLLVNMNESSSLVIDAKRDGFDEGPNDWGPPRALE